MLNALFFIRVPIKPFIWLMYRLPSTLYLLFHPYQTKPILPSSRLRLRLRLTSQHDLKRTCPCVSPFLFSLPGLSFLHALTSCLDGLTVLGFYHQCLASLSLSGVGTLYHRCPSSCSTLTCPALFFVNCGMVDSHSTFILHPPEHPSDSVILPRQLSRGLSVRPHRHLP